MTNTSTSSGQSPALAEAVPFPRRWWMLPVVLAAMFMAQFDLFVVNVAAESVAVDLRAGPAMLVLIIGGYAFTYASGLITGGRLGDIFGHRRMFLAGAVAFTIASLLCGLAQSPGQLVAARLVQGVTAAAMVPQVLALITAVFPPAERPRALGWFGVTMGVGAVAGQVLGGGLLELDVLGLGWRVAFLVNLPIGLAAVLAGAWLLPRRETTTRPKLDPLGAIGLSAGLALALIPLVLGRDRGWPAWCWVCLVLSVPVLVATLAWERRLSRRGDQPLLELGLFADRIFTRGLLVNVGAFAAFHSFLFCLTLVLQAGIGLSPLQAGLTFGPLGVAFATASIIAQRLVRRYGALVIVAGALIAGAGLAALYAVLAASGEQTSALRVIVPVAVVGAGNGLAVPALIGAVLAGVHSRHAGAAAGVLTTSQQFASAVGIAVLGTVFFVALGEGVSAGAYAIALRWEIVCSLALCLLTAVVAYGLPRPGRPA
ncbi:MFS transporter [Actinoplanes sp. NPDC049596]|uniref:MFS transporter n=1 Tax=unclassified Actinoplanes TaxID=2626549 RepID=UPI003426CA9A